MDVLEDFNPLDVLAAAAAWQSANQSTNHVDPSTSPPANQEPENRPESPVKILQEQPLVRWQATPYLDHSYAFVPRDDNDVANGHDLDPGLDDVDSSDAQNGHVTEPETELATNDESQEGHLYIVVDEDLIQNGSLSAALKSAELSGSTNVEQNSDELTRGDDVTDDVTTKDYDTVDGVGAATPSQYDDISAQLETNNNTKKLLTLVRPDDSQIVPGSGEAVSLPLLKVETESSDFHQANGAPETSIPGQHIPPSTDVKMSPKTDLLPIPKKELLSPSNTVTKVMTSLTSDVKTNDQLALVFSARDQVVPKLSKPHELLVKREGLLGDKLVSPPGGVDARHTCVSIDCCSPSDITARDLCVDRLSSASSQDLYTEDGQESPRSMKISPHSKPRRQQRGIYNIHLGPLLSDAQDRPEHPLKDHDYCLHSFYLAMTHNRIDEPVRRPGPQPKCKDSKMKRKADKAAKKQKKRRSKDDFDSDLSPFKEDVFSDTDSFGLDSPSKSRMSSPTNSLTSSLDLSRERIRIRDKRMNSLPSFLDKPKETTAMSNFNDNYVFFGKKPKRRNRTMVENNEDKLKKFNHSEFLPGLDISYLEARAKFHKKVEPEIKTEIPELDLSSNHDVSLPKGGLAYGISEEESQFIDSLHCDTHMDTSAFHPQEEITHEQVKELLTAVGVDNAMKLIEADLDHGDQQTLQDQVTSLNSTINSMGNNDLSLAPQDYSNIEPTGEKNNEEGQTNLDVSLDLPTTTSALNLDSKTDPTDAISSTPTKTVSPTRPKDLPFSPLKPTVNGIDLPLSDNAMQELGEDLATPEMHDTSLLGGTTPELNLGNVSDLGATTPDLPFGGTTPHDLLDLDDTDLLNANLNLNMNMVLNFQSPEKVYHPNAGNSIRPSVGLAQRKLDLDLTESYNSGTDTKNRYIRNNPQTMGKPEQVLKSQMFKSLSELGQPESQDNGVPELITVNMYWNDLPGLLINGKQYVRLVDIHKQVLPAKPTGLLKNRCRALNMEINECSELQRDFLIRYAHAAASRSQIIVTKDVAETLIGYYVDKPPVKKADDSASVADGSTYSYNADDIATLEDVMLSRPSMKKSLKKRYLVEGKPRGRPKGASVGSSCVNVTFKLSGEVFQKRVQTTGFSLLCEDSDSDDTVTDVDQRISSAAARFQKILNLRAQIKSIRAEIYAIQKRQQRAEIRKAKGLAKRQRSKPNRKMIYSYEPKRLPKTTTVHRLTSVLQSNNVARNSNVLEKSSLPTVRVAPNVDSNGTRSSTPVSPAPRSSTPNVIVETCTPFNVVPSAIVTPLNARLDDDVTSLTALDTSPDSSYMDSDQSKLCTTPATTNGSADNSCQMDFSSLDTNGINEDHSYNGCDEVVLVKPDPERRLSLPAFRCSTPSDNGKPTRLAVQHYNSAHDCQNGYLYLNMFVSIKSSCVRCATCFQLMTVHEFLNHLHSSDDVAQLIRHSIAKPRNLLIQDDHYLTPHQLTLWQQFQLKNNKGGLSPLRGTMKKKELVAAKRKLKQNVQLARVARGRTTVSVETKVPKERIIVKAARPATVRRSLPVGLNTPPGLVKTTVPGQEADSSRYSGRVRKRKQFSPDEGYTLPKVEPKMKKSRSDALLNKRPMVRISPLSTNAYGRPVCKVSPRPVAKISPVQAAYKSPDRQRQRSGQR